jgi:hypothetical protein
VKFNAKKRRKVILLGDSHIRGCSEILGDLLGTSFSVIRITKPNYNMKAVINSINFKAEKLSRRDVVILCGGTRDIAKNETNNGLRYASQFANSAAHTNVIIMCAPTGFVLLSSSCVNKEVASFNRKLQKVMKPYTHVEVCSVSTNWDHFTSHGMHMNVICNLFHIQVDPQYRSQPWI